MLTHIIKLESDTITAVKNKNDVENELLARDLCDPENGLFGMMSHYCKDDSGETVEGSMSIEPDSIEIKDDLTGTFQVSFEEYIHSGCRDLRKTVEHMPEIDFKISLEHKNLTLIKIPYSLRESYLNARQTGEIED